MSEFEGAVALLCSSSLPLLTLLHCAGGDAACEACQKSIEASRGKLVVKEAARAVSERDDRLLAEKLEALENANKEVGITRNQEEG